MMTIQHKLYDGGWFDIKLVDACTPLEDKGDLIGQNLAELVEKKILTFEQAIFIIGESNERYRGY